MATRPKGSAIALVVSIFMGVVLLAWLGVLLFAGARASRGSRHRAPLRDADAAPEGLRAGIREPAAVRAPFALTLRGDVLDIAQSWVGEFRGGVVGITDATVRTTKGQPPRNLTIATLDVDWLWPWLRLRRPDVDAPQVDHPRIRLLVAGAEHWVVEAADPDRAADVVTEELFSWLARMDEPMQVEFTPRHVLVAVEGQLPDDRLGDLLELVTGIPDHVPSETRAAMAPPDPADDVDPGPDHPAATG